MTTVVYVYTKLNELIILKNNDKIFFYLEVDICFMYKLETWIIFTSSDAQEWNLLYCLEL